MRFKVLVITVAALSLNTIASAQPFGGQAYAPPTYQPNARLNMLPGFGVFNNTNGNFLSQQLLSRQYTDINRNLGGLAQQTYDAFGQTGLGVSDRSSELITGRGARYFYYGSWYPTLNQYSRSPIATGGGYGGAGASFSGTFSTGPTAPNGGRSSSGR